MGVEAVNFNYNSDDGLWITKVYTNTDKKKKDTIDETQKVPGLGGGVAFGLNGASFADTIKESYNSSGNNCAGI